MQKWNKFFSLALMSAALCAFAPSGVQAQNCDPCCDPCWDPCNFGEFEVGVDFLWWKPCVDDLDYCADRKSSSNKDFKHKSVCLDWEPGVRVFLGKPDFYCGWDFGASYTYISSCTSSTTKHNGNIVPTNTHSGFTSAFFDEGKGSWDSCYHEWDLLISFDNSCNQCHQLSHYFGVAGIVLDQELKATLENSSQIEQTKWDSDYWGVGFRLGTDYNRRICDCFSFFANGNATILVGDADSKTRFDSRDSGTSADHTFKDDDTCQIVPGYHLSAGFSYDTCVCDWDFSLRLGYEFLVWHNLPNQRTYVSDSSFSSPETALSTSSNTRTFGYHGLLAGVQMSF